MSLPPCVASWGFLIRIRLFLGGTLPNYIEQPRLEIDSIIQWNKTLSPTHNIVRRSIVNKCNWSPIYVSRGCYFETLQLPRYVISIMGTLTEFCGQVKCSILWLVKKGEKFKTKEEEEVILDHNSMRYLLLLVISMVSQNSHLISMNGLVRPTWRTDDANGETKWEILWMKLQIQNTKKPVHWWITEWTKCTDKFEQTLKLILHKNTQRH